jgi:hypothetical protein
VETAEEQGGVELGVDGVAGQGMVELKAEVVGGGEVGRGVAEGEAGCGGEWGSGTGWGGVGH